MQAQIQTYGAGGAGGGFRWHSAASLVAAVGFGFEDIFDSFFGGGGSRQVDPNAPRQGC